MFCVRVCVRLFLLSLSLPYSPSLSSIVHAYIFTGSLLANQVHFDPDMMRFVHEELLKNKDLPRLRFSTLWCFAPFLSSFF